MADMGILETIGFMICIFVMSSVGTVCVGGLSMVLYQFVFPTVRNGFVLAWLSDDASERYFIRGMTAAFFLLLFAGLLIFIGKQLNI